MCFRMTKTKCTSAISLCPLWRIISTRLCCRKWCRSRTLDAVDGPSTRIWSIRTLRSRTHPGLRTRRRIWNSTPNMRVALNKSLNDLLWRKIKTLQLDWLFHFILTDFFFLFFIFFFQSQCEFFEYTDYCNFILFLLDSKVIQILTEIKFIEMDSFAD